MTKALWITIGAIVVILVAVGIFYAVNSGYKTTTGTNTNPESTDNVGAGKTHNVNMANLMFSPVNLPINVGDTVTWTNSDNAPHTITSDSGSELASGTLANGATYSHTFNTVGTFKYHCSIHPMMKANIIVQ